MLTLVCRLIVCKILKFQSTNFRGKLCMSILKKFGNKIIKLRKEHGWSQEELAFKAGMHRTYIGMIERGEKNITLKSILKLSNAFNFNVEDLLKGI